MENKNFNATMSSDASGRLPVPIMPIPIGAETNDIRAELTQHMNQEGYVQYFQDNFYYYNGTYYTPQNDWKFRGYLYNTLNANGADATEKDVKKMLSSLKLCAAGREQYNMPNDPSAFLYRNGLVHATTGQITPPSTNYFSTGCINANFIPEIRHNHPIFDSFLYQITSGDPVMTRLIWESLAYIISPDYSQRLIFCLIGAGGTGKSLLIKVMDQLLSPTLISNLKLQDLTTSRFSMSQLVNKRVNFSSDEGDLHFKDQGAAMLKLISGSGEMTTADVKNRSAIRFQITAKMVFASNYPIHVSAAQIDPYLKNRMLVIPFVNPVPPEQQDPCLLSKILTELDAIATEAFFVYQELRARSYQFSYNPQFEYMATAATSPDTIRLFSQNCCLFGVDNFLTTQQLYGAYQASFPQAPFADITAFSQAFATANVGRVEHRKKHTSHSNLNGYYGVALKNQFFIKRVEYDEN